jgi:hypothetical protein
MKRSAGPKPALAREPSCSFCGAAEAATKRLIAGDRTMICEQCILAAVRTLVAHATDPSAEIGEFRAQGLACSFCHRTSEANHVMVGSIHARVCDRCLCTILGGLAATLRAQSGEEVVLEIAPDVR